MSNQPAASPFKLLDAYEAHDYQIFFGRESEKKALYELVTKNRLCIVYGPSGTGKTSMIRCGLAGFIPSSDWLPIYLRRGDNFNISLKNELNKISPELSKLDKVSISEMIKSLYDDYLRPVYLIFDQFEELFIINYNSEEENTLYQTLVSILNDKLPCRIVIILREDYFGHLNSLEKQVPYLFNRKLRVEAMNRENLRDVIVNSCKAFDIEFGDPIKDPESILDRILSDRSGLHMPYVQVYLDILFREAISRQNEISGQYTKVRFDQKLIEEVGEIHNVLTRFVQEKENQIQQKLKDYGLRPPENFVQQVLDQFISPEGTKIPVSYETDQQGLIRLTGKSNGSKLLDDLVLHNVCIQELEKNRILRRSDEYFELAHDSLADILDKQKNADQRYLSELRKRIEIGYLEYIDSIKNDPQKPILFERERLARIEPYKDKLLLKPEWLQFLALSEEHVRLEENAERDRLNREKTTIEDKLKAERRMLSLISVILALALASLFWAFYANNRSKNLLSQISKLNLSYAKDEILDLNYVKAQQLLRSASDAEPERDAVAKTMMEIALFYAETGHLETGWKMLDTIAELLNSAKMPLKTTRSLENFHRNLRIIDSVNATFLFDRYFPRMVPVKGGTFALIDQEKKDTCMVTLRDYEIGRTEVTRWQYFLYCQATGKSFPTGWRNNGNKPITNISWYDALEYANWLSIRLGNDSVYTRIHISFESLKNDANGSVLRSKTEVDINPDANGFCLPTEAQWEYAARGGAEAKGQDMYSGSDILDTVGWYSKNSNGLPQAVALKKPNELGIYDMSGNVWEWCWDWYSNYPSEPQIDPIGPVNGDNKVMRGGSWYHTSNFSKVDYRQRNIPEFQDKSILGFRLARNIPKNK